MTLAVNRTAGIE